MLAELNLVYPVLTQSIITGHMDQIRDGVVTRLKPVDIVSCSEPQSIMVASCHSMQDEFRARPTNTRRLRWHADADVIDMANEAKGQG